MALAVFVLVLLAGISQQALADAGVFTGNGQNLHQITSKTIQLVNIDVTIVLGRGPFLFDGTVAGMDRADYECTFSLRNLSEKDEDVKVGFPVDSQFAQGIDPASPKDSENWVLEYGFIARDEKTTYHVNFVGRKPHAGPGEFGSVFVWSMHFAPKETKTLTVEYRIPMSMGLIPMEKKENAEFVSGVFGQEFLNIGQLDMAGYITSTGSSWAGNVESARFTVFTQRFEQYFDRRGLTEDSGIESDKEDVDRLNSTFPVRHPWWFRQIEPDGWQAVKGGVQWQYNNFKPKDPIQIRYYTTPFPKLPQEVDVFVDRFLKALGPKDSPSVELAHLKQVFLAVYGCAPTDQEAEAFASRQLWYSPNKDCSAGRLNEDQRAVLQEVESRIAATKSQ